MKRDSNIYCTGCGARLREDMKICPNCGKIVEQRHNENHNEQPVKKHKPAPVHTEPDRQVRTQACSAPVHSGKSVKNKGRKKQGKLKAFLKLLKIAVIVLAVYAVIFAAQVFRIRLSSYDFDNDMKMSMNNFGEALDNYFDDGKWSYNPFTFTATYKGTHNKEDYEIRFKALVSVKVSKITVDGEPVTGKAKETTIMGMYI